jgi:hypothetical protein
MYPMWHESFIFLNPLLFIQQLIIVYAINKGLPLMASLFRSEGKSYLSTCQRWHPEVWKHENLYERRVSQWRMEL